MICIKVHSNVDLLLHLFTNKLIFLIKNQPQFTIYLYSAIFIITYSFHNYYTLFWVICYNIISKSWVSIRVSYKTLEETWGNFYLKLKYKIASKLILSGGIFLTFQFCLCSIIKWDLSSKFLEKRVGNKEKKMVKNRKYKNFQL